MTHIALDAQEEAVKRFVLSLPVDPRGAVLELDGKAIICVLPAPRGENGNDLGSTWTEVKNDRRCALIDREIVGTLTPAESSELQRLQREMLQHRRRVAPLPLADARRLHQELLTKAGSETPSE